MVTAIIMKRPNRVKVLGAVQSEKWLSYTEGR